MAAGFGRRALDEYTVMSREFVEKVGLRPGEVIESPPPAGGSEQGRKDFEYALSEALASDWGIVEVKKPRVG